jgi:PAT family beta-lactamase induction signal transducer AmpG
MRQQGVGIGHISEIIGLISLPTSLYFFWSPITDFLVQRRTWVLLGALSAGVLMAAAFRESNLAARSAIVVMLLAACCSQLVVSSCGGMMGALHTERARRVASSSYQAGSAGFGAAAAFLLILVGSHDQGLTAHAAAGDWWQRLVNTLDNLLVHLAAVAGGWHRLLILLVAALIVLPGLFALTVPRQVASDHEAFGMVMHRLGIEFKSTFWRWAAIPYTLLMLFPMNSGAAVGLLPGIARDYGVSGAQVAWMNGFGGTILMAVGSASATLIPAKIRASVSYLVVGIVNAATLSVLWFGSMRPAAYFLGSTLYLFTVGMGLATFTAVVLEFMGRSGKSGSGRYSIINSMGNVPVLYMIRLDGWGGDKWGARGLAGTEVVVSAAGALILLAYFITRKNSGTAPAGIGVAD